MRFFSSFSALVVPSFFTISSLPMAASIPPSVDVSALPLDVRAGIDGSQYLVAAFETRKPELSVAQFIDYYDNVHVPIIKSNMKEAFPLTHARYYLKRQTGSDTPVIFGGQPSDFNYDVITIMTFENETQLNAFNAKYTDPTIGGIIQASAEKFIVSSILRIVGLNPPHITRR